MAPAQAPGVRACVSQGWGTVLLIALARDLFPANALLSLSGLWLATGPETRQVSLADLTSQPQLPQSASCAKSRSPQRELLPDSQLTLHGGSGHVWSNRRVDGITAAQKQAVRYSSRYRA